MAYRLTRKAADDVLNIYAFGAERFGPEQADAYHALLQRTFEFLAANPHAAWQRTELTPPVRIHPLQSHLVIYLIEDDGEILIIRVRHGHEDWADPQTAE
ncbi:type II toxin-antitoxin system RelE/ParE family toxin [Wenzhouxiangella marina]|uniref:Toxin n=1 Tax=Wenzhouxiangella marina TaxID=1579979 RepID=A0A0K0XZX0_9GAMM|nr:type II toxin-antitoxin system RelE/ParE family toxin [Wenzhouxiangella marina]AKS43224.1 plasmid stabilization protein ParE [Wenzhouxiangella marina]MBB6087089.1 toxin ParE1/3/4 [Wenzhouxiangella marina]